MYGYWRMPFTFASDCRWSHRVLSRWPFSAASMVPKDGLFAPSLSPTYCTKGENAKIRRELGPMHHCPSFGFTGYPHQEGQLDVSLSQSRGRSQSRACVLCTRASRMVLEVLGTETGNRKVEFHVRFLGYVGIREDSCCWVPEHAMRLELAS
jgi:hypothetical protein